MSLAALLLTDAASFLSQSEFGEQVTYTPRGGVGARTINAIIDRSPKKRTDQSGKIWQPSMVVVVANSATTGILSSDTKMIGGSISFPFRIGQAAQAQTIRDTSPVYQDAGCIEFAF